MRLLRSVVRYQRDDSASRALQASEPEPQLSPAPPPTLSRDTTTAYKWWVSGIILLATIIVVMSFEALSLALPTMMVSMRVGLQEMSWTLTGYLISRTLFVGTAGWLGNRLGNRNLFALSLAIFTGGALLCGLAWSFESLVLFRILQGVGAGPMVPLIMVILHDTFPPEQRGMAQSLYMVGDASGSVLGRGLAGYLIDALGWRSVFYLNVPLGLMALVGLLMVVPNRREPQTQPFDALGLLFLAAFVVCLLVGLQSGAHDGWSHTRVRMLLILAGVSLVIFVSIETVIKTPLIDLKLFRNRDYSLICLVSSCNIVGLMGAFLVIPLMLQRLLGLSPIHTGMIMIPGAIAWGVFGALGGKLSDRVDTRWLLAGSFGLTIATLLQVAAVTLDTPAATISWRVTCLFGATALSFTPLVTVAMRTMPVESLRMGMGMLNLLRGLAAVVGIATMSILLEHRQRYHFQLLSEWQSQRTIESEAVIDQLQGVFRLQGNWPGLADHKALAVMNEQVHTTAALQAYQECYLGMGLLYACLFIPVFLLQRRYAVPDVKAE